MLRKLSISNYAIIENLELEFSDKLTVITGETGAGKSIAIESLSLVLGERADASVLYDKQKKCIVEAYFDKIGDDVKQYLKLNDLDLEEQLILRRELSSAGKSRAFINDTPVTLFVMKSLGNLLVDTHNQLQSQELTTMHFQLALLDSLAKHEEEVAQFRIRFKSYIENGNRRDALREQHMREVKELDYLNFQYSELAGVSLVDREDEILEQEQKLLEHTEEIKKNLSNAIELMSDSEFSIKHQLKQVIGLLNGAKKYYERAEELILRLESARIELGDIEDEIQSRQQELTPEPDRLDQIHARLNIIYKLQKKHHAGTIAELLEILRNLEASIQSISFHHVDLEDLEEKIRLEQKELIAIAKKISSNRTKQIPVITQSVNRMLKAVGMPHAEIKIEHESSEEMNAYGMDYLRFLFSSNKGSAFQEIRKIASGGELSRLMLCLKSLIASSSSLPTLIFDEIDTGISGETAMKVSTIIKELSTKHQVICITHLPHIAAKGDMHYFVYKETIKGKTHTNIRCLDKQEKIRAIAQMISGEKITAAALQNAAELLN
ncbi:MAG: DNA repair protein RecN [Chitinophagales bacterium]|nr:DNA repair protein RecN [Chitinophagales bacterium]